MAVLYGCDWTEYQGQLDPAAIAGEGFTWVKLKVGGSARNGWGYVDPAFTGNAKRLQAFNAVVEPSKRLRPMCYWYFVPQRIQAQVGLLLDVLGDVGGYTKWHPQLDVEASGLTAPMVQIWAGAWKALTSRLDNGGFIWRKDWSIYTRSNALDWSGFMTDPPVLENAHWVDAAIRRDTARPYASQQYHGVQQSWWTAGYGGWIAPTFLQFTDNALVNGRHTCASAFTGSLSQLDAILGVS